jgi:hypothetical protein
MKDAIVPPEIPPRKLNALVEVSISRYFPFVDGSMDLRVLLARYAAASDGTESNPQEGTMMAPVFVAK